jgi:CRISPR/Cas system-associated protein Cas5 (RAMP superfamily)
MWIAANYHFPSTFSYKIPDFSMYYAASSPVPSPSTFKLALVSALISQTGDIQKTRNFFNGIKTSEILFGLPEYLTIYKAFIKRLKKRRQERGFDRTFGIREYVTLSGPLTIYLNVLEKLKNEVFLALKNIRYIGSSDSICSCMKVYEDVEPQPQSLARPYETEKTDGIIFQLRDFKEEATFDKVNRYSNKKLALQRDIRIVPYILPLKVEKRGKNFITYKLIAT